MWSYFAQKPGRRPSARSAVLAIALGLLAVLSGCEADASSERDTATASDATTNDAEPVQLCNGRSDLCDRRLDQVAFAATHNAMSAADWQFFLPNQPHGLLQQLDAGIRGMLLDIHMPGEYVTEVPADRAQLCHANCLLGKRDLAAELVAMGGWLDAHPNEVLVWILEDSAPIERINAAMQEANFVSRCAALTKGQPLPTLRQLIAARTQVFVMLESGREDYPWAHSYAGWAQDNPYSAETVADFACTRLRGSAGNPILNINHFLTTNDLTSREQLSTTANAKDVLFAHVLQCQKDFGQLPNLVSVDWYTTGALFELVDALNDAGPPAAAAP